MITFWEALLAGLALKKRPETPPPNVKQLSSTPNLRER